MSGEDRGAEGRRVAASPFVRGDKRDMMKRKRPERLTPHEELFVKEYLVDLNATQAWIRAGGDPTFASRVGPAKLKAGTLVSIAVGRALAERSKRVGITADRVLMEIARVALGDPRVLFRPDGSLRAPTEYNEDDAAMIEGIKTRRIVEVAMETDEEGSRSLADTLGCSMTSWNSRSTHRWRRRSTRPFSARGGSRSQSREKRRM